MIMIMIMMMMTVMMRQARRNAMDGKKGKKNFKRHKIPSCTIVIFFFFLNHARYPALLSKK